MTVILLGEEGASEADHGGVVGEDPDHVGAAADFLVDPLQRVRGPELGPVLWREQVERDQIFLGVLEQPADLRGDRLKAGDHVTDPLARLLLVLGVEHLSQRGSDQAALVTTAVVVHVSDEVHVMQTSA
jgi:hypothetical protein